MVKSHSYCVAFSDLIRDHLQELASYRSEGDYARNQVIYFAGDSADSLFQVTSGRVKVIRVSPVGKEKIIDIYQDGDYFGELCICGGGVRGDQAIALDAVTVSSIKIQELLTLLPKKPGLMQHLLQLLCMRLSEYQDQIATLAFDNVPERLAREFLRLSKAPGAHQENGATRLGVNLTHEEMASLVGTSREIVTTLMNQFRGKGLIDYDRRSIRVFQDRVKGFLGRTSA